MATVAEQYWREVPDIRGPLDPIERHRHSAYSPIPPVACPTSSGRPEMEGDCDDHESEHENLGTRIQAGGSLQLAAGQRQL